MIRRPPRSTLFPYTRSSDLSHAGDKAGHQPHANRKRPGVVHVMDEGAVDQGGDRVADGTPRSEEHTSELQSHSDLVCRLLLEKKKKKHNSQNSNKKNRTNKT